jgi:hypothetical protein
MATSSIGERFRNAVEAVSSAIRWIGYYTGILWLTPFVGMVDRGDLELLMSAAKRDLAWLDVLIKSVTTGDDATLEKLRQVQASLQIIVGERDPSPDLKLVALVQPVRYPWHVARGWTDYGAVRLALLAALPPTAQHAALAELRNMKPVVVTGNRDAWDKRAADLEAQLPKIDDARRDGDAKAKAWADSMAAWVPQELQALWREVDFGRNYWRSRVAKQTTTARITWALVVAATAALAAYLTHLNDNGTVKPWVVTLCGLLGGSVSALSSLNFTGLPERGSLEVEAVKLRLRPVIGAMAAIVFYVIGRATLVFQVVEAAPDVAQRSASLLIVVGKGNIHWAYYAIGFLAGFSERLFLSVIGSAGDRLSSSSNSSGSSSNSSANTTQPTNS